MPNDFQVNGATPGRQSRFTSLYNSYFAVGLCTQRNPLRPANSSALTNKIYGSKNDSLLDGSNVEVSNRLTMVRRPGSTVYNSQTFPAIDSFYSFHQFDANTESIKVIADTSGVVYDATGPSTKAAVLTKSAGAGQAYFQSVGNILYIGDGVDQVKWLQNPAGWQASHVYNLGDYIVDSNGNIELVTANGTSGTTQPAWPTGDRDLTSGDGSVQWTNMGSAVENWGVVAPTFPPAIKGSGFDSRFWTTGTLYTTFYSIIDPNGNVQYVSHVDTLAFSRSREPVWATALGATTKEVTPSIPTPRTLVWTNGGPVGMWVASTAFPFSTTIQDTNGNLQVATTAGTSGTSVPTWGTGTPGTTTTDGGVTWTLVGPGYPLTTGTYQYAYSYHTVSGNVSTASPLSFMNDTAVGNSPYTALLTGFSSTDTQVDQIWIWRTVQNGSLLFLLDTIPNPYTSSSTWTYTDTVPDTSLNAEITAPIASSNNPPPVGTTKMTYHLGRIWGAVNNSVYFSGGPDVVTGNGAESFPPANVFVFPDTVNYLFPSILGLFVFTVSDIYVIQGTTTSSFFSAPFALGVGLPSYNAFTVNGSTPYFFTSDGQVVALDMSGGITEVGFNIGDQFLKNNWNPQTLRVSYHIAGSTDKGLYVSDYSTGWLRMYPTPSPETGQTWTPFASIVGGCSQVQSIATAPGVHDLLIGPPTSGPILKRDDSVFTDAGAPYGANFTLGSMVIAQPGQLGELQFITTDSMAVGSRPTLSVQLDEIAPFSSGMFEALPNYVPDPPQLSPSVSMHSDRWYFSQTQQPALGRSLQIRLDWGTDTVQNELLSLSLFGGYSVEL